MESQRQLKELYLFSILFSLAQSLMFIFEPIFFYTLGIPLAGIAMYYALHYMVYFLLLPLGGRFAARFGAERSLAISTPLAVVYFLCLALIPVQPALFWVGLVLLAIHKIFYWPAFYADTAASSSGKKRGLTLSWMTLWTQGTGVAGPVIGGLLILWFGFPTLFVVTAITALVAGIPLLTTKERFHHVALAYGAPWRLLKQPRHWRLVFAMGGMGDQLVALVFWPIYMFIVLGSAAKLGFISSVAIIEMTIFGFWVGILSDRVTKSSVLKLFTPFMMIANLLRPLVVNGIGVFLVELTNRLLFAGVMIPLYAKAYDNARKEEVVTYVTAMEMVLAISKVFTASLLVIIFLLVPPYEGFVLAFVLAAVMSALYRFL
jgi:MFS family permease